MIGKEVSRGGSGWGSIGGIALALGIGALGVFMAHHPMIGSGFRRIQIDLQDTRLIHYLLEHSYLWARRVPGHRDLWSPPFFYPAANVAAYSDLFLSLGPVYWFFRVFGLSPDLSFGLWMVSMSALNYAAGLWLFGRGLGFGMPASVAGASLVAFGAPRVNQMGHPQLLPCFYVLISVYALSRLAGGGPMSRRARAGYWLMAVLAGVAQLYGGAYLGWFLMLGTATATVAALALPSCRTALLGMVKRDSWMIVASAAVGVVLLQPFLAHYLPAAKEVKEQFLPTLRALHPGVWSWLDMGPGSWLWGWTAGWSPFRVLGFPQEHHLGIGLLTPILCAAGLYLCRERPICRLAALAAGLLWLATTYLPGDKLVFLAGGVCCYCAAGLFYETGHPLARGMGLAVVLGLVLLPPFPNPYVKVLGLTAMVLCLLEIRRLRDDPRGWIIPGLALAALGLKLFDLTVIAISVTMVVPIAVLLAGYDRSRWREVVLGSLASLWLFLFVVTFLDRPGVLVGALVAAPMSMAASAPRGWRPTAGLLLRAMLIAVPFLTLFYTVDSLWLEYFRVIPGALAMRAIGRIVLILLIPAALGLSSLVELLAGRGWVVAAWLVPLMCLAEQGVTTETFDAAANRAKIMDLARRIDRGRLAFYYHPCDEQPFHIYQLDAMWASLATGVPTINGSTGYAPRDWFDFFFVDNDPDMEVEDVLARWEQARGLPPDRIQWIGADCPRKNPGRPAGAPGESREGAGREGQPRSPVEP
ncbi:MAG: hypothetical protein ACLQGP_20410 [Isosphaeraceae bacterium]